MALFQERRHVQRSMRMQYAESDTVGVQDFVLLDDYTNEDAFIQNLQKRFAANLIYVRLQPSGAVLSYFLSIWRE